MFIYLYSENVGEPDRLRTESRWVISQYGAVDNIGFIDYWNNRSRDDFELFSGGGFQQCESKEVDKIVNKYGNETIKYEKNHPAKEYYKYKLTDEEREIVEKQVSSLDNNESKDDGLGQASSGGMFANNSSKNKNAETKTDDASSNTMVAS